MNAVPAVIRVVQAIDPISHAPIAQDVVESFIILLDQLGDDLVFFFRFWDISLQPLIIGCSRNTDLTTQPANAPALLCVALLDCFIDCGMAQPSEFRLPSRAFNFLRNRPASSVPQAAVSSAGSHAGGVPSRQLLRRFYDARAGQ